MNKGFIIVLLLLISLTSKFSAVAQQPVFTKYQDSLIHISESILTATDEETKIALNAKFVQTLISTLKIPYSFNYNFPDLKSVSVVNSSDSKFKFFTWFIAMADGTYRYYGAIQQATTDGKLKLLPLTNTESEHTGDKNTFSAKNWLGARYYDIITVAQSGKPSYYLLLGWKGKSSKVSSKLIEPFYFEKEEPVFGKQVFEGSKALRMIYEYHKFNSMTLQQDNGLIVFDHLAPVDPSKVGNPEFYVSDSSFDAYKIANGKLKLLENVELKNPPAEQDALYNDPKSFKPATIKQ